MRKDEHDDAPRQYGAGKYGPGKRLMGIAALLVIVASGVTIVNKTRIYWEESSEAGALPLQNAAAAQSMEEAFDLSNLALKKSMIRSGGPPKDGIPALTDPEVVPAKEADHLDADDRVVGVVVNDKARAYPIGLLNWHECVNDKLGGVPVAVVYCPLCDSVTVVDRRLNGKTFEFGISGLLANSNVLLYDRTDQAIWSQVKLTAVSGPHAGESLKHLPFELTTFGEWRDEHPESDVLTFETGHQRNYKVNPYRRYFESDRLMFPVTSMDERLSPKTQVIGVRMGDTVRAYAVPDIIKKGKGRVEDKLDGKKTIILEARADKERIEIVKLPEEAEAVHTFWFAWAAFHPETGLYGSDETPQPTTEEPARRAPRSGS